MQQLTLAMAQAIVSHALAGQRSDDTRRVAVVVVDAGGHPLCMAREEETPPLLSHIAEAKAKSCIVYGKPTRSIKAWERRTFFHTAVLFLLSSSTKYPAYTSPTSRYQRKTMQNAGTGILPKNHPQTLVHLQSHTVHLLSGKKEVCEHPLLHERHLMKRVE